MLSENVFGGFWGPRSFVAEMLHVEINVARTLEGESQVGWNIIFSGQIYFNMLHETLMCVYVLMLSFDTQSVTQARVWEIPGHPLFIKP